MAKTITKKKSNNEPPIFRSLTILTENLFGVVLNMQKDVKMTFGHKVLNTVCDIVFGVTSCYYENSDNVAKLEYAKDALNKLQGVDTILKLLFGTKNISRQQLSNLAIKLADAIVQLRGWKNSIEKKMEL